MITVPEPSSKVSLLTYLSPDLGQLKHLELLGCLSVPFLSLHVITEGLRNRLLGGKREMGVGGERHLFLHLNREKEKKSFSIISCDLILETKGFISVALLYPSSPNVLLDSPGRTRLHPQQKSVVFLMDTWDWKINALYLFSISKQVLLKAIVHYNTSTFQVCHILTDWMNWVLTFILQRVDPVCTTPISQCPLPFQYLPSKCQNLAHNLSLSSSDEYILICSMCWKTNDLQD